MKPSAFFDNLKVIFSNRKILIPFIIVLILFSFAVIYPMFNPNKPSSPPPLPAPPQISSVVNGKKYPFDTKPFEAGYSVGNVKITLDDLEKEYQLNYPDNSEARNNLNNWEKAADKVTENSIIQNEGIQAGLYKETDNSALNPDKVNQAKDYLEKQKVTNISGEVVSIWFYNTDPPKMGVEVAKAKTRQTIEQIRADLESNKYTFVQAGKNIAARKDLEVIDPSYQTNAYIEFSNVKPTQQVINDLLLNDQIWKINVGEISPVLVGRDFDGKDWYDAYFVIIKVNDKKTSQAESVEDLIKSRMQEGEIINLQ